MDRYEEYVKKRNEYAVKYYHANKDKIKARIKKRSDEKRKHYDCECGGKYTNLNKNRHFHTQRHLNYTFTNSEKNEQT